VGLRSALASPLAALRARQWLHFVALPLCGWRGPLDPPDPLRWLSAASAAACALAWAYGLNAVAERRFDASARKNPLVASPELAGVALTCAAMCAVSGLLLAAWLSTWAACMVALSLAAGTAYSVGPRAKRIPGAGLVLNCAIFVPLTALLVEPGDAPGPYRHELAVFVLLLTQNQLVHELADAAEDARSGALTTARALGEPATRRVVLSIAPATVLTSLVLAPDPGTGVLAAATAALATLAATAAPTAREARVRHRRFCWLGGALLFMAGRWTG
jgi:4-hydroxybenzoate polyprenyltransferase